MVDCPTRTLGSGVVVIRPEGRLNMMAAPDCVNNSTIWSRAVTPAWWLTCPAWKPSTPPVLVP